MSTITRLELRELHAKLTQKVERVQDGKAQTVGGKYAANNTLKHVKMLFNTALRLYPALDAEITA